MIVWVLYDIVKDKSPHKSGQTLSAGGLYRVQFSCFLGTLTQHQKDTLQLQLEELIDEDNRQGVYFPDEPGRVAANGLAGSGIRQEIGDR